MNKENKKTIILVASNEQEEIHQNFIKDVSVNYNMISQKSLNQKAESDDLDILLLGGDGSLNYLVNNLDIEHSSRNYNIIYFPTGTANDFAKSLNIPASTPTLSKLKSILKLNRKYRIPLMSCNDKNFINVASAGAPARVTDSGHNLLKSLLGKASYYISSLDKLLSSEQYKLKLINPETKQTRTITTKGFIVSQGIYAGGGVRVTTNYCANFNNTFNFVSPDSINIQEIISSISKLQNIDIETSEEGLISLDNSQLHIECEQTIPLKLDGEEYSAKKLFFKKCKKEILFYQH